MHFLRFELTDEMAKALKSGLGLAAGVDHPMYRAALPAVPLTVRNALAADLE